MFKKITIVGIVVCLVALSYTSISVANTTAGQIYEGTESILYRNVTVYAPAVADTDEGYVGIMSTITVSIQSEGSGKVFVDTLPLTQVDMQGSARLAVKVASALVESDSNSDVNPQNFDYFFVVRTDAPIIGGPSAGGIMTVATVALLENWSLDEHTVMTGMINPDGSIGHVGGITKKIDAAYGVGAKRFLIPKGQGTYQEAVSETVVENGWTRTEIQTVTRDIVDYVRDMGYAIEVVEVEDVDEAVKNFTGYSFSNFVSDGEMKSDEYINAFLNLSNYLLQESNALYDQARNLFNSTKSLIPNKVWDWDSYSFIYYRSDIEDVLDNANILKEESETWFEREAYYTSTTKSFLSLMSSRYAYYVCNYFNTDESDRVDYVRDVIDDVNAFCQNKNRLARNSEISGFVSLQCVGGAQKRASETIDYLSNAAISFEGGDYLTCLDYLARAKERSESIGWWLNISSFYNESGDISTSDIDSLALEYIEEAQQAITYSAIILDEMGSTSIYLSNAQSMLEDARGERESGYPAAALFEALDAITRANLEIETIGVSNEDAYKEKISRINNSASNSILKSIGFGIKPVLPVCYYEYGDSLLEEDDLTFALFYYRFSGMIAGALSFTNISKGSVSSRYEGIPDYNPPQPRSSIFSQVNILLVVFILGGVAGLGFGLLIAGLISTDKTEKPKRKKQEQTGNVYKYYPDRRTSQRHYKYPNNDTPRSVRDYYKKNK